VNVNAMPRQTQTLRSQPFDVCLVLLSTAIRDARTLNIARTLAKHGKRVCILAFGSNADAERFAGEGIILIPLQGSTHKRFIKRWLSFGRRITPYLWRVKARSYWSADGYSLPFTLLFAKLHRARLVYDAREIYSALGPLAGRPLVQRVIAWMERVCVRFVDAMFTSGQLDSEYLQQHFRLPTLPRVVMNLPPYRPLTETLTERLAKQPSENRIRQRFGLPATTRILVYQGMIFDGRGIMPVVRALPLLPDCAFVLLGEGRYKEAVEREAGRLGVADRVLFAGAVPYDELLDWTTCADAGMALIEPISFSYRLALPNKLFEYCMAGIPSVVSDLPAMKRVVAEYPIGICVAHDAPAAELAQAIETCLQPDRRAAFRAVCEQAARAYSWEAQEPVIAALAEC
jgi:glycosyltransferase involved in cell wall biosynthesis